MDIVRISSSIRLRLHFSVAFSLRLIHLPCELGSFAAVTWSLAKIAESSIENNPVSTMFSNIDLTTPNAAPRRSLKSVNTLRSCSPFSSFPSLSLSLSPPHSHYRHAPSPPPSHPSTLPSSFHPHTKPPQHSALIPIARQTLSLSPFITLAFPPLPPQYHASPPRFAHHHN